MLLELLDTGLKYLEKVNVTRAQELLECLQQSLEGLYYPM